MRVEAQAPGATNDEESLQSDSMTEPRRSSWRSYCGLDCIKNVVLFFACCTLISGLIMCPLSTRLVVGNSMQAYAAPTYSSCETNDYKASLRMAVEKAGSGCYYVQDIFDDTAGKDISVNIDGKTGVCTTMYLSGIYQLCKRVVCNPNDAYKSTGIIHHLGHIAKVLRHLMLSVDVGFRDALDFDPLAGWYGLWDYAIENEQLNYYCLGKKQVRVFQLK